VRSLTLNAFVGSASELRAQRPLEGNTSSEFHVLVVQSRKSGFAFTRRERRGTCNPTNTSTTLTVPYPELLDGVPHDSINVELRHPTEFFFGLRGVRVFVMGFGV
jgi:hypothetical protein